MKDILLFSPILTAAFFIVGCSSASQIPVWDLHPGKRITVQNVGGVVNDSDDNYAPAISPDGRTLFYSTTRRKEAFGKTIELTTIIQRVPINAVGEVDEAARAEAILGAHKNAGGLAFSGNGEHIVFVSCNEAGGAGDCDLYETSDLSSTDPTVRNLRQINTRFWEAVPSLSDDGNTLYFCTNKPAPEAANAEEGSIDIHVTRKSAEGFWSKPVSVRAPVNSQYREDGVCLAMGDSVLFFSSNRPGGYGGFDLYVSFLQPDGGWGPIYNLGPQINSSSDERHIAVSREGDLLFFSSNKRGDKARGKFDIYVARFVL